MSGWTFLTELVSREFEQSREEGKDLSALAALQLEYERAGPDPEALTSLQQRLVALPVRPDFPFVEPNDLATIRSLRKKLPDLFSASGRRPARG